MGRVRIILARSKHREGKSYLRFFARTVAVLLVPFCFPDKAMDLSCNNAVFTFGLFWTFGDLCSCDLPQKRNDNKTADLNGE